MCIYIYNIELCISHTMNINHCIHKTRKKKIWNELHKTRARKALRGLRTVLGILFQELARLALDFTVLVGFRGDLPHLAQPRHALLVLADGDIALAEEQFVLVVRLLGQLLRGLEVRYRVLVGRARHLREQGRCDLNQQKFILH